MASVESKKCQRCKLDKSLQEFRRDRRRKDGLKYVCKTCDDLRYKEYRSQNPEAVRAARREQHLKHKYGITTTQYEEMLAEQQHKCAACGNEDVHNQLYKSLVVDHCHKTGTVRGLLCHSCNTTLGASKEDATRLEACIRYLRNSEQ